MPIEQDLTLEQRVEGTIRAARDSVWVVNDSLEKMQAAGGTLSQELRGNIQRNVGHLELVMADPEISGSGQDLSDLTNAIAAGKAVLG